jgi:hypothetical protein
MPIGCRAGSADGDVTSGRPSVSDCVEACCGEAVVSGCDTPEVLRPAEHTLDGVATAVERGTEAALLAPGCLRRDVRHRAACFDRASEAIRIEGAISDHQGAFGNTLDQRLAGAEVGWTPRLTGRLDAPEAR